MQSGANRRISQLGKGIFHGGHDSLEHDKAWSEQRLVDFYARDYHKPSDEYDPSWDLLGASQDVMLLYTIGASLSSNRGFPSWNEGNEFKATRDASLAAAR